MNPTLVKTREIAEAGDVSAQHFLGLIYSLGQFVSRDLNEARKWWELAAEQGHAEALFNLGTLYSAGWGVSKDKSRALDYFLRAAEKGNVNAQFEIASLYLANDGVPLDPVEAAKWCRHAANNNVAKAQYQLGVMLYEGNGVNQDRAEAAQWYLKAAEQGLPRAQFNFGLICMKADGVPQDHGQAAKWLQKAAEQDLTEAMCPFGALLAYGLGIPQDRPRAEKLLRVAGERGDANAKELMVQLGMLDPERAEPVEPGVPQTVPGRGGEAPPDPNVIALTVDSSGEIRKLGGDGRGPDLEADARRFLEFYPDVEKRKRAHHAFSRYYLPSYVWQNDHAFLYYLFKGVGDQPPLDSTRFIQGRWNAFERQLGYLTSMDGFQSESRRLSDLAMSIYSVGGDACALISMPSLEAPGTAAAFILVTLPVPAMRPEEWPRDAMARIYMLLAEHKAQYGILVELNRDGGSPVVMPSIPITSAAILRETARILTNTLPN